jgi:hypothetical protein
LKYQTSSLPLTNFLEFQRHATENAIAHSAAVRSQVILDLAVAVQRSTAKWCNTPPLK